MQTFRSWSRRAWLLHGYLIATMVLLPVPRAHCYWTDNDADGISDSWMDPTSSTLYSLAQLDDIGVDYDGDGAYNEEEMARGSDPLDYDTDDDGLNDGDEIHLAIEQAGKTYSLTIWDSNGDGVSDFDDFYSCFTVIYPNGQLPAFAGATYSDYDGDGIKNPSDPYPTDPINNDADSDGLDDVTDPVVGDATNPSPYNSIAWGADALGDADMDSALNFWDQWPYDSSNGSNDSDGDGITNETDPFPTDNSNFSSTNFINWNGDVFGDADSDGVQNYADQWPYDASNGTGGNNTGNNSNDNDNDGISNDLDPAPGDSNNYSSVNGYNWYALALEDADNDGTNNFSDAYPYDLYNGLTDADYDGWENSADPYPTDSTNFSSFNQIAWGGELFGDTDSDGTVNWQDVYPDDPYDGNPDYDNDGISNDSDPFPREGSNYSSYNQVSWGPNVLGDDDGDGTVNWLDDTPYTYTATSSDSDNDGFDDSSDPVPNDSTNPSPYNSLAWFGEVFGDADADGVQNFYDQWPNDRNNGVTTITDSDGDGIPDDTDPIPNDSLNYSSFNWQAWYGNALADDDNDGTANFYDSQPEGDTTINNNVDGDSYDDSVDPAPNDLNNYSPYNGTYWYSDALNDADGDSVQNFFDQWPGDPSNGNTIFNYDSDGDGIQDGSDPAPGDSSNYSTYNGQSWYSSPFADDDNDSIVNFYDYQPYGDSNSDSDTDGIADTSDPAPSDLSNYSSYNNTPWYSDALNDADGDAIQNFFDTTPYGDLPVDNDGDGLFSNDEATWGTSDSNRDSDDDGLTDGEEVHILSTNPANAHSRSQTLGLGDLYTDWELVDLTDSDSDGIPDRIEQHYGLKPNWALDALLDRDNDGMNNITQYLAGVALNANLSTYDADGDGMTDVFEDGYQLAKNNPADAVLDADGDGVLNYEEQLLLTSPQHADTLQQGGLGDLQVLMLSVRYPDGSTPPADDTTPSNGIPDWADAIKEQPTAPDYYHFTRLAADDLDDDGMPDAWEHQYGRWKFATNGLQIRFDDAEGDADSDGLPNLFEYMIGTSPLAGDTDDNSVSDANEDSDGDGLSNLAEWQAGTNPKLRDSDGDGISDDQEVAEGTDPTSAASNSMTLLGLRVFSPLIPL